MINARVLRGTWQARRASIASLCDAIDAASEEEGEALERRMFALIDEVEHLRLLLREVEGGAYLAP